jgi:hypothetical protein
VEMQVETQKLMRRLDLENILGHLEIAKRQLLSVGRPSLAARIGALAGEVTEDLNRVRR